MYLSQSELKLFEVTFGDIFSLGPRDALTLYPDSMTRIFCMTAVRIPCTSPVTEYLLAGVHIHLYVLVLRIL